MPNPDFHTRRSFLRTTILGGALASTMPGFLQRTFAALETSAADSALQIATGRDHPILVVLQLSGGNDGLNTVIPFSDDAYYRARPTLAVPSGEVLKLDDNLALNPRLARLARHYDDGHVGIIHGVGYPNPNRSHFRSMSIWQSASDAERAEPDGWLGRYFDNACRGDDPAAGISISERPPEAFSGNKPRSITLSDPRRFEFADDPVAEEMAGGSIDMLEGSSGDPDNLLDYIERVELGAQVASSRIEEIVKRHPSAVSYPKSALGSELKLVAQLIAGGMSTRVYYVSQGGFDTHASQINSHHNLMGRMDEALDAFVTDLKQQGNFQRVLIMTFSEFGRRVAENASKGTDHGAAAPMFLLGGAVKPGIHGHMPSLTDLEAGDLKFNVDFRSVYASVLENWMKTPSEEILRRRFSTLPIV